MRHLVLLICLNPMELLWSWVQLPPGPFLSTRDLRYYFEFNFNNCRTKSLAVPWTDKIERRDDDMLFDTPRLYISPCPYAVPPLMLHPILLISILLCCHEQLSGWILRVEPKLMMV